MNTISKSEYINEKQVFSTLLIDTSMIEVTYSETFNLIFYKEINVSKDGGYNWIVRKMNLIIDAPFWVGERTIWEQKVKNIDEAFQIDHKMLAYELVNIRQSNFIYVNRVEFFEKYLCIYLNNEKIIAISYSDDSDYSWILEEYTDKPEYEKISVFCQGNEIFAINIPEIIQ